MRAYLQHLVCAVTAVGFFTATGTGCGGGGDTPGAMGPAPLPGLMAGWGNATPLGGGGLLTYALTVDPAELDRLVKTATMEVYVPAELTVSGKPVGKVGLRYKGSDGTLAVCFAGGRQICDKASFKIKFDLYDPNLRFEGTKRLNFHNMMDDQSLLRERLAVEMYDRMGVETSRVVHAYMTINGEPKGLFAVVENLDGRFTKSRWPTAGNGNLYKESWPTDVMPDNYSEFLETNEEMPDNRQIAAFAQALYAAKPAELPAVLDRFAHLEQLMRYLAVDRAINNRDGITAFYCNNTGQACSNHNFYWYQHEADNRFLLVPWDLGVTFFVQTIFDRVPAWDQPQLDCGKRTIVEMAALLSPGCDLVFQGLVGAGRPAYDKALDQLLGVWNVGELQGLIDRWAAEIAPGVAIDPYGPGLPAWRAAVESLKGVVSALRERLEATRAARTVPPFGLVSPGTNDFEAVTPLAFSMGASGETSPRSGSNIHLNENEALSGTRDMYFGFELANDELAATDDLKAPWAALKLPMADGPKDLSRVRTIRLKVSADNIRRVRIELDSPKYPNPDEGIRFGRDFLLNRAPTEIVIPVGELTYPSHIENEPEGLPPVLTAVSGLLISPTVNGQNEAGLLPKGKADSGFVRIDDVRFEE